jgi:hypothetical protein
MRFVRDDGGRSAAGFKGNAGDCVVRAVAIATEQPYQIVYDALSQGCRTQRVMRGSRKASARDGVNVGRKWFHDYLVALGWRWNPTMLIGSGCKVHLKASELPMGRLIVYVSKHVVAVVDGVIRDLDDCSRNETRCVYGYWIQD